MILFYSDYLEGAHPEIIRRLGETNLEQTPGYGEDLYCEQAREVIRKECGLPDADVHFLVGGTQTNVTVISSILRPYQGVLCASTGHINVHETGAIERSGHKVIPLQARDGKISAEQVREAMRSHFEDPMAEHTVQPGMLYISFPTELGTLYTSKELADLREVCTEWNIPLFVDGARLGYALASEACDIDIKGIASAVDVFYIGGTKQGTLFGEAVVIRSNALKKDFRYSIKQNGGMLAKGRLLGIQFLTMFEDGLYYRIAGNADRLARRITEAFRATGHSFLTESPTNQVFPILSPEEMKILSRDFGFEVWEKIDDDHIGVRFCTSWATREDQADALVKAIEAL